MRSSVQILLISLIATSFMSCSMFKKNKEKKVTKIENTNSKKTILFDNNKEPFYTKKRKTHF